MAPQMGLVVEVFVISVDVRTEERNLNVHFSLGECGCKVLDCRYLFHKFPQLKSQLTHQAIIIELFGGPGHATLNKTQVLAITLVGQHSKKGVCV